MHPALLIGEIQLCIFNQLSEKRTLNALARTCQIFSEAALDVLWRDLDSFARLIQCMPEDLCRTVKSSYPSPYCNNLLLKLRRSITSSDWVIFQKYSRRVHSIRVSRDSSLIDLLSVSIDIDEACVLAMCSSSSPARLLPNLTLLSWSVDSDVHFTLLPRLLSHSLTYLRLFPPSTHHPSQELISASQLSFETCPSLKSLAVSGNQHYPPNVLEGLKRSISQLQNLNYISWDDLGNEAILSLARLPTLTRAMFEIPSDFPTYIAALPSGSPMLKPAFSRVRILEITRCSLASVTAFLKYFNVDLEQITLWSQSLSQATMVRDFITALGLSSSCETLHDLAVYDQEKCCTDIGFLPLELGPLLRFYRLQHLELDLQCAILINDATLLEIADAWPNISTLLLNADGPWLPGSHATPLGLARLLKRCPQLKFLCLPVDFSSINSVDYDPFSHMRDLHYRGEGARLRALTLGPFNVSHPHAVARFLAIILPSRANISMRWGDLDDDTGTMISRNKWNLTESIYYKFCDDLKNGNFQE
ncbi:hypothetical protein BJ138DRAFT_489052 [Hygrophoropsis aurantiaca]|uniref:Uncharacterized protein n=1 Tax=Hygrophoropsis aurantiaca TaxID=72124 RepID=A0ACB8ALC5_9AGAM|nr:hypothetical protein BJ138DRAFT_489052 [Hygrophoropsis aurantiaca]